MLWMYCKKINLSNFFDEVFDIKMANYIPKPEIKPYQQIIDLFNIDSKSSAMFDDIAKNLVPAKKVGFTPVWVDAGYENFSDDIKASKEYLDYQTRDLSLFLKDINEEKDMSNLENLINKAFDDKESINNNTTGEIREAVNNTLDQLDKGKIRVCEKIRE